MALTHEIGDADALARLAEGSSVSQQTLVPFEPARLPRSISRGAQHPPATRIVFVNRYFYPDVSATSQILFDLAQRLVERGLEVHVVCSRQLYDDPRAELPEHESIHGIQVHRAWTSRFGRDRLAGRGLDYASFYVTATAKLLDLLRADDVVIAKTDPPLISIVIERIAKLRGAVHINWLQDVFPEIASHLGANPLPSWLNGALRGWRDCSLRNARMNVVLGTRMREHLESRRIPAERICVIENWADGDVVVPKPIESSELRQRLGLAGKFVVGYSGNLGRAHEFETLLAAAERMRGDDRVVFLMVGGGAGMQQLKKQVEARCFENFRFLPYQPREALADALAAADVHLACLLPQLEGLIVPSKFYGILAAARPVVFIGDRDGELARIIRETGCGMAVETGDASELCAVLRRMQMSEPLRMAMGQRGKILFNERYTVRRATEQWMDVLHACGEASRFGLDAGNEALNRVSA